MTEEPVLVVLAVDSVERKARIDGANAGIAQLVERYLAKV